MHYEDDQRPQFDAGGTQYPLHLSGAPMPSITLVRPMQSQVERNILNVVTGEQTTTHEWVWGFLCCIHAARGKNSYSHYYGWIGDLGAFQREFLQDPESALLKHFKWKGLEKEELHPANQQVIDEDIFAN